MGSERTWSFVGGFVAGAAAVYLLDPRRGAARRALLRDKGLAATRHAAEAAGRRGRDVRQRLRGLVYETKARLRDELVPDEVLVERVRAQLGRPVSHLRAIEVRALDGCVTLSGPILASEAEDLIDLVARIAGVRSIESELELHDVPGNVPSLHH